MSDVAVKQAQCIASIKGEREMPVRDVRLNRVTVAMTNETPIVTENVVGFSGRS